MFNIFNFNPKIMKKYFFPALLGAIALSGPLAFTSCSSDEDVLNETNPNYNAKTNEVTTQFVFNVSNGNTSTTRQSEAATQASSSLTTTDFRGIDHSYIMCFKQDGADGTSLSSGAATATKSFDMSRVVAAGTLDNGNSRRVLEMSLPLNTNTMLFYGRAIQTENNTLGYNKYGHLDDYTVTDNLANVNFQLGRRLTADNKTKFQKIQTLLAAVLSCIMNTNRGNTAVAATDAPTGAADYGFALPADYQPNMTWEAYKGATSPVDGKQLRPLETKLKNVYKEMTTIQTAELRNASGFALKETVKQLWSIVNSVRCATPTCQEEALAKYMAYLIDQELRKYFTPETVPNNGGSVTGVTIKDASSLISALALDNYWPSSGGEKPSSSSFDDISTLSSTDMGKFPEQFELPQGSTHIKFNDDKKTFYYVTDYNSSAVGGGTFTVDDYYYPAELCYFGNSPLRVSDTEHVVSHYPESVSKWNSEDATSWSSDWSVGHVQSSTRSVAMKNDINYGTSLLKTTISYGAATLMDNNAAIQLRDYGVTEANKEIAVTSTSFKLVGVIVGDQWPKVGWDFLPKTTPSTGYRKGYIYDNQIQGNGGIPTTGTSTPTYTLVFDNYQDMTETDATNKQSKVYVALEFENNTGMDFFGKDNLIANGSHFYLIGELDPSSKTAPDKPAYHALPPYTFAGSYSGDATKTVPRVFIQDHMTTANFKIGVNSLKYAYLTVPDLRSSSVTLGLSVDLKWETGIVFDDILLGGI